MFNIGLPELILIALVVMIFVGPERLPEMASWLGKVVRKGRDALRDIQTELDRDGHVDELREMQATLRQELNKAESAVDRGDQEIRDELRRPMDALKDVKASGAGDAAAPEDTFSDEAEVLRSTGLAAGHGVGPGSDPASARVPDRRSAGSPAAVEPGQSPGDEAEGS